MNGLRAERLEQMVRGPVRRRLLSPQEPRRAEHERAGADGGDKPRCFRLTAHEGDRRLVVHERVDPRAAWNAQNVEQGRLVERQIGREDEAGRRDHRLEGLRDQPHARAGPGRKNLVRPGQVELLDIWKDQKAELERCRIVGHDNCPKICAGSGAPLTSLLRAKMQGQPPASLAFPAPACKDARDA